MNNLIPKNLLNHIPKLYETEEQIDPIVYVKLFLDGWTWFITEISIDKNICFGYVISPFGDELGYFSLEEIKTIKNSFGLEVEIDLSFKPTKLSIVKKASNINIPNETKNNFKGWRKEKLNFLQKHFQNIKNKIRRKRIIKIFEKLKRN